METKSCYLDGRYFNLVLKEHPGLLENPLHIVIKEMKSYNTKEVKEKIFVNMRESKINTSVTGLLRLVIETPKSRHSNLLILDYVNQKVYRFEPLGSTAPYFEKVNRLVEDYLSMFFDFDLEVIDLEFDEILDEKNPHCKKSGFCTAYIILYALAYLTKKDFEPSNIRKFANKVEKQYGHLLTGREEIEFGHYGGGGGGGRGGGFGGGHGYGGGGHFGYGGGYNRGYGGFGGGYGAGAGLLGGLLLGGALASGGNPYPYNPYPYPYNPYPYY